MTAATRRIFSVLIVCWLNLVILPCAMAIGGTDCPHSPPAAEAGMAAHEGHHGADAHADCASAPSDCCELGEATLDRGSDKFTDASDDLTAFASTPSWPTLTSSRALLPEIRPPDRGGSCTPLHVLNCVYLK